MAAPSARCAFEDDCRRNRAGLHLSTQLSDRAYGGGVDVIANNRDSRDGLKCEFKD